MQNFLYYLLARKKSSLFINNINKERGIALKPRACLI